MTTPADELRAAADKLRQDAEAARRASPPPWADLPYIAAMHPGVGTALADLLDDQADGDDEGVVNPWSLAVARAINGSQP